MGLKRSENTSMRVFLPNKDLITKDLTTSQAKAWGDSQFLYYNTLCHAACSYATDDKSRIIKDERFSNEFEMLRGVGFVYGGLIRGF
ncbi:hypothetical protein B0X60_03045 [Helicobacter pylori]|nr:hypothetical protein B0X34_05195 [Helicobacter pylori]OOQ18098.1 hypothetical protein B0X60_03045 [Helicobacter pylori]QEF35169.1 hypothetical protein D2C78_04080 [Helicobacter pylori]RVZ04445.1 hypothetical protein EC514_06435 [Helicobacter pylori]RVZ51240.1 hypothetical protein EC554_01490 [Helicobacter pylori]